MVKDARRVQKVTIVDEASLSGIGESVEALCVAMYVLRVRRILGCRMPV